MLGGETLNSESETTLVKLEFGREKQKFDEY